MSAGLSLAEPSFEETMVSNGTFPDAQTPGHVKTADVTLHISDSIDAAAKDWNQLLETGHATPYQSRDWCQAYQLSFSHNSGSRLLIAAAHKAGKPVMLLPMSVEKRAGLRVLGFLGANFGNQNTGLWDKTFYDTVPEDLVRTFLDQICHEAKADCLILKNVPVSWHGRAHPLALEDAQPSPSPVFRGDVVKNFQDLFAGTHNKSARKNLARKQRHLKDAGEYLVGECTNETEIRAGLQAFFSQREARARITGIPNAFAEENAQAFLKKAVGLDGPAAGGSPPLHIWTLKAAGEIRATYLCARHQDTLYAYSNSVAHDEMLKNSPGLVLIREIIEEICADPAVSVLDLGIGEERYKTSWTSPEGLCDGLLPMTARGALYLKTQAAKTRLKSAIRNSDPLWQLVRKIRQWRAPDS